MFQKYASSDNNTFDQNILLVPCEVTTAMTAVVTSQGTNNIFYIAHLHTNVQLFSECILVKPKTQTIVVF